MQSIDHIHLTQPLTQAAFWAVDCMQNVAEDGVQRLGWMSWADTQASQVDLTHMGHAFICCGQLVVIYGISFYLFMCIKLK